MNPKLETIKMFGPSISDPTRMVNRDVPVADEQAYVRAGYKRGSLPDSEAPAVAEPVKSVWLGSEEVSLEDEPIAEAPKPRKRKGQS